jgi:hypothetical protein
LVVRCAAVGFGVVAELVLDRGVLRCGPELARRLVDAASAVEELCAELRSGDPESPREVSAHAVPAPVTTAAPIPSATANAPT